MATSNIPTAAAAPSPADPAPAAPAPAPTQNSVDSPAAAGGRRFGSIIRLRPECVEEYKRYHADAWPAVAQQIRECNIREYVIYHDSDSALLFSHFTYVGTDFEGDMRLMCENPTVREWWRVMDQLQESLVPGATSSESGVPSWWKPLEEVFYQA